MAQENAITAADTCAALDVEFIENFEHDYTSLSEAMGLYDIEVLAAGTALYQYKVSGTLSATVPAEGEEAPLSKYKAEKVSIGEMTPKRYRKQSTAEAILKGGLENAVLKTDKKMRIHLWDLVLDEFYAFLAKGTGKVSGTVDTLQKALVKADSALVTAAHKNHDSVGAIVHYVNNEDVADYLGEKDVVTQTDYGISYLTAFLGVSHVVPTPSVKAGTVVATPVLNIHPYTIDFSTLADAGLEYTTSTGDDEDNLGIVGVHHSPDYNRGSVDTHAMFGLTLVPEIKDYVVNATFKTTA